MLQLSVCIILRVLNAYYRNPEKKPENNFRNFQFQSFTKGNPICLTFLGIIMSERAKTLVEVIRNHVKRNYQLNKEILIDGTIAQL